MPKAEPKLTKLASNVIPFPTRRPDTPAKRAAGVRPARSDPPDDSTADLSTLSDMGGLIETGALGAGDHHMAGALVGQVDQTVPAGLDAGYYAPLLQWQDRASRHIAGNISAVPGTIEHGWHGSKVKRGYVSRWDILRRNHFNPAVDIKRNTWQVLELAGNKPQLRMDIDRYFRSRDEDSNQSDA